MTDTSWTARWSRHFTKRRVLGLLGAGVLLGGLAACSHAPYASHRHGGSAMSEADMGQMRARMTERVARELQLDDAQKARLATLADAMTAQRKALMPGAGPDGKGGHPREAMAALIQGEKFDRAGAKALVDSKTAAVREQSPRVVEAAADFFDSLKPEQQQKVREFLNRGGRRHHHGHG